MSRDHKIKSQLEQLKVKQSYELSALRQKIELGKDEQRKAKELGLERLKQKFQNVKKELEVLQQSEVSKFEKSAKNTSVLSMSKMRQSKMNSTMRSFRK